MRPLMNAIFSSFFKATSFNLAPAGGGFTPTSTTSYQGFAGGGHFSAGQMMTVGERGPELAMFDRPGMIIPHGAAAGGTVQNITIDNRGADFGTMAKTAALIAQLTNSQALERMRDRAERRA